MIYIPVYFALQNAQTTLRHSICATIRQQQCQHFNGYTRLDATGSLLKQKPIAKLKDYGSMAPVEAGST